MAPRVLPGLWRLTRSALGGNVLVGPLHLPLGVEYVRDFLADYLLIS